MKVFLDAYFRNNLGDDIFVKIFLDRYNEQIYSYCKFDDSIIKDTRLKTYHGKKYRILNKILKFVTFKKIGIKEVLAKKADISVLLGGSMFIENKNSVFSLSKPYYILGTNFGPYKTQKYFNSYFKHFSNAQDVCFREKYSKNLFKDIKKVRSASDIIFSLNTSNIQVRNSNKVIISVIDCDRKISNQYTKDYENKIIQIIEIMVNKGYEVVLMSFCKAEKDEEAIERILEKIKYTQYRKNVSKYYYSGNIEEALNVIGDCKIIFGTRFHANILGMLLNKTVIPIAYSDKTLNILYDMKFDGIFFDIRKMENFNIEKITDKDLNYKFNVDKEKEDAQKHFSELDKILKKR